MGLGKKRKTTKESVISWAGAKVATSGAGEPKQPFLDHPHLTMGVACHPQTS
jgi:hypothetical protein